MKKFLFMIFICGLTTQNSLNAVDCKPLTITTNSATVVGYVDCNNMEAHKSLGAGEKLELPGSNGVRPGTMVRVEHQRPLWGGRVDLVYQEIGEGLTIECVSHNIGTHKPKTHNCKCNGSDCKPL